MELKEKIEAALSQILSEKHDCKISIKFIKKDDGTEDDGHTV